MTLLTYISMSEIITTYLPNDPGQALPMDREDFYQSQIELFHKGEKPNRAVAIAQILLFTPDKEIIIQKRSKRKKHNAGLIDKTIGGHITFGDTPTFTVLTETLQEMQIPSIVLDTQDDFKKTYRLLKKFVGSSALVQFIDSRVAPFNKVFEKETVPIINKYYFYLGVYSGAIRPADKEAAGIMFSDFDLLKEDMAAEPELFTNDLRFFLDKYERQITEFLNGLS